MKTLGLLIVLFCTAFLCSCGLPRTDKALTPTSSIFWDVDNLDSIGGSSTRVLDRPCLIETDRGKAVEFDGIDDGLIVDALPLAGAVKFTLEIIFRPDADGPAEQRFLHLQENGSENRILIETRVRGDKWYLDTYIRSPHGNLALFDPNNNHTTGRWYSAALTYDGGTMRHYVNGIEEMSGKLAFSPLGTGKTSIGVRMNRVYWFKGAIRKVKFTPHVLDSKQLLRP